MIPDYPVIDAHIHIQPWHMIRPDALARMRAGRDDIDEIEAMMQDPDALLRYLDLSGVEKVAIINYVSPDVMGVTTAVNDWVAEYVEGHRDRLIPFGSVHPRYTDDPAAEMDRILGDLGLCGIKIHPPHQQFYPNAYRYDSAYAGLATVYEKAQDYGVPVMIHTGTSVFPRARNIYADPIYVDDVIVDFPDLKVIIAHGGRPIWMQTAFFLMRRHHNVYLDISSIPPQNLLAYFPRLEAIADRTLFGSDWPGPGVPDVGGNIEKFMALPISDEAKHMILRETALEVFGSQ